MNGDPLIEPQEVCARCRQQTGWTWDYEDGWQSECCGWPSLNLPTEADE